VEEATTTPATMGTSVATTGKVGTAPRKKYESTTVKNGSRLLMVCVSDTFTAPSDMLVVRNPSRCMMDSGATCGRVVIRTHVCVYVSRIMCVCVCVCARERERESLSMTSDQLTLAARVGVGGGGVERWEGRARY
jgi:hypothetical protein